MNAQRYGEHARPWPSGHSHGEDDPEPWCGSGYFSDYRAYFERWVCVIHGDPYGHWHVFVHQDEAGFWWWGVGTFSWTPDGDLLDIHPSGMSPTRARAEEEGRRAAETARRLSEEYHREYETRRAEVER